MDLVEFADKERPLLDELEGEPPERLAMLITSAVIANPMTWDDLVDALYVTGKVLLGHAEESQELAQVSGANLNIH